MGLGKNYVPHMVGTLRKTANSGAFNRTLYVPLGQFASNSPTLIRLKPNLTQKPLDLLRRQRVCHRAGDPHRNHIPYLRGRIFNVHSMEIFRFSQHLTILAANFFH
jgi:hypothetical protein